MRYKRRFRNMLALISLIFGVLSLLGSARAMVFKPGGDVTIDCDVTINYGVGMRVSDQKSERIDGNYNGDDGNRNFEQWDMINNKVTLLGDIDIQYKDYGLFIRPKAFYDHVYMSDNANNSPATNNAFVGNLIKNSDEWAEDIKDIHGRNAEILDLYGYADFNVAGRYVEFRVGRQVISWGTSFLVSGGISSAQSHMDVSAATAVGTEVKEIYLPSESVDLMVDLTDNLTLDTYYQWQWYKNVLYEGGTFYATTDFVDEIEAPILAAPDVPYFTRADDHDPSDGGQYGVSLTYQPPWAFLNSTEFGVYYINYHDKMPQVNRDNSSRHYWLEYTEDIKLYGVSFDTAIGDANVAGEFSYREDYIFDLLLGLDGDYYQAQLSWMYAMPFDPFADRFTFMGEMGCLQTIGLPDDVYAWRYVLRCNFDWYQLMRDLDTTLSLAYSDFPHGETIKNLGYTEKAAVGAVGFDFVYKNIYKAGIKYEDRFNINARDSIADRDTLSIILSYTF